MHNTNDRIHHRKLDQLAAFNHCRVAIRKQMRILDVERMSALLHVDAFERELEYEAASLRLAILARTLVHQNRKLRRHFRGSPPDRKSQTEIRHLLGVVRHLQRTVRLARANIALVDEYWAILNENRAALVLQAFTRRCLHRRRLRRRNVPPQHRELRR